MRGMPWKDEAGLTLAEILVAVALITIGLVAVMQWFPLGTQGMDTGRKQSTSVFLAERKIEQIKAWSVGTAANQGFLTVVPGGACFNAGNPCVNDAFNAIPGYPEYSRTVILSCLDTTVTPPVVVAGCPATSTARLLRVQVNYRRVTSVGTFTNAAPGANQVELSTILSLH